MSTRNSLASRVAGLAVVAIAPLALLASPAANAATAVGTSTATATAGTSCTNVLRLMGAGSTVVASNYVSYHRYQAVPTTQPGRDYYRYSVMNIQRRVGVAQDGVFGSATESAVKRFQKSKGLLDDGWVGTRTLAAMGFTALPGC